MLARGISPRVVASLAAERVLPQWVDRAAGLLVKFVASGPTGALEDHLAEGGVLLSGLVTEICDAAGGECGPSARSALHSAVLQKVVGTFLMLRGAMHDDPTSREAIKLFRTGSAFLDASRQNSHAALETAVRIAKARHAGVVDPLEGWMDPPVLVPTGEPGP